MCTRGGAPWALGRSGTLFSRGVSVWPECPEGSACSRPCPGSPAGHGPWQEAQTQRPGAAGQGWDGCVQGALPRPPELPASQLLPVSRAPGVGPRGSSLHQHQATQATPSAPAAALRTGRTRGRPARVDGQTWLGVLAGFSGSAGGAETRLGLWQVPRGTQGPPAPRGRGSHRGPITGTATRPRSKGPRDLPAPSVQREPRPPARKSILGFKVTAEARLGRDALQAPADCQACVHTYTDGEKIRQSIFLKPVF